MIKNLISLTLLIVTAGLSLKHGWDAFNYKNNPQALKMMNDLGIGASFVPFLGGLSIATGILLLIPQTFFLGNILNATAIMLIMILALRTGNYQTVLIEIPFLAMPLILIWLKYPFKS